MDFKEKLDEILNEARDLAIDANAENLGVNSEGHASGIHPKECPYLSLTDEDKAILDPFDFFDGTCVLNSESVCEYFQRYTKYYERIYCSVINNLEKEKDLGSED